MTTGNFWNITVFLGFIVALFLIMGAFADAGMTPTEISIFDMVLLALATLRLTRLVVYDKIFQFFRDWFNGAGEFNQTIRDLITCPWCTGVWAALVVSTFYFATPYAWFPIFVLAVAGLGSLLQVAANVIGWSAEAKKLDAQSRGGIRQ